jgi:hypothetical protein
MQRSGPLLALLAAFACVLLAAGAPCTNVVVSTVAGSGSHAGQRPSPVPALQAKIAYVADVAVAADGSLIIAEQGAISKLSSDGTTVTRIAGPATIGSYTGYVDGTGDEVRFNTNPMGICVAGGIIYVADSYDNLIRKVTMDGVTSTYAGSGADANTDGPLATAGIQAPSAIVVDPATQTMYVAAALYQQVLRKIDMVAGLVAAFAGDPAVSGFANGVGTAAHFSGIQGLALDLNGNVIVADTYNQRIRKVVAATATATTVAGSGTPGFTDSANPLLAKFYNPAGIVVDGANSIYVSVTYGNHIRKIDGTTGAVTTIAGPGTGSGGFVDGSGCSAKFNRVLGLALGGATLYLADYDNHRIRAIVDPSLVPHATPAPDVPPPPPDPAACVGSCVNYQCEAIQSIWGGTIHINIQGSDTPSVWGDGPYSEDSVTGTAAVHAGRVAVGQSALLAIQCVGTLPSFGSSTSHGVTTTPWPSAWQAFVFGTAPVPEATTCYHSWCAKTKCVAQGQVFELVVTGQTSGDSVWGDIVYTDDSDARVAAVHSGVLSDGETATLVFSCHGYQASFAAATRATITTTAYGAWGHSWSMRKKQ